MDHSADRSIGPNTELGNLQELVVGSESERLRQFGNFFEMYQVPLEQYLVRTRRCPPTNAYDLVSDFFVKKFGDVDPLDSLPAKYLRKLGLTYLCMTDQTINDKDIDPEHVQYLAGLGAAQLGDGKLPKPEPPNGFDATMVRLGLSHFEEVRAHSKNRSFRGFLLQSLYHFSVDQWRQRPVEKQMQEWELPAQPPEPSEQDEAIVSAKVLLSLVRSGLEQLKQDSALEPVHWDIFDAFHLAPGRANQKPTMHEVAVRFREAIVSSSKSSQDKDWTDDDVADAARSRLDAFRRALWDRVKCLIQSTVPLEVRADLMEAIQSRTRNQLLRQYCELAKRGSDVPDSDYAFASVVSDILSPNDAAPSDGELADEWARLISAPLYEVLCRLAIPSARRYRNRHEVVYQGFPLYNLEQCWRHPSPPEDLQSLFEDLKTYAKGKHQSGMSRQVREALYATSIATAKLRYGRDISTTTPSKLVRRFQSLLEYGWLDVTSRDTIRQFISAVEGRQNIAE